MNNKERIKKFMKEYEELCIKYGISLSHEDCQGAFIIDEYDKDNVEWVKSALDGFEIRDGKNKEIERIKIRLKDEKEKLAELLGDETYFINEDGYVVDVHDNVIRVANLVEKQTQSNIRKFNRTLKLRSNIKYL